uniref:Uncharacterized protein n=1 Tax=Naja naja TaxID=35670 RepID=A0A8C6X4L7_NAJNA
MHPLKIIPLHYAGCLLFKVLVTHHVQIMWELNTKGHTSRYCSHRRCMPLHSRVPFP